MPLRKEFDVDLADASLTGFASNVTGAAFTLTANVALDGLAHKVSIRNDSASDHSGKTVTLVGTDAAGNSLTEVVTGPAGSATVESSGYFKALSSSTPSATIGADTFDIGWVDEVATPTFQLNHYGGAAKVAVDVTGTVNFTVQETYDDVQRGTVVWSDSNLASLTADVDGQIGLHATATRLIVNSYSSGAELQFVILQGEAGGGDSSSLSAGSAIIGNVGIDQTTPGTTNGVTIAKSAAAAVGIAAVVSSALETGKVIKASAGNLYGLNVTTTTAAGIVQIFNSATVPAAGAVTPIKSYQVPAANTLVVGFDPPLHCATGISVAFSTATTPFTKTDSATAFISGDAV